MNIIEGLKKQVANAFVMYLNYKRYHWQIYGIQFRDLHKLFDKFAEEVYETIDDLAERVRIIGDKYPPASIDEIEQLCSIYTASQDPTISTMLTESCENVQTLTKELTELTSLADSESDYGTVELLSSIIRMYQKQEWYLRMMKQQ